MTYPRLHKDHDSSDVPEPIPFPELDDSTNETLDSIEMVEDALRRVDQVFSDLEENIGPIKLEFPDDDDDGPRAA